MSQPGVLPRNAYGRREWNTTQRRMRQDTAVQAGTTFVTTGPAGAPFATAARMAKSTTAGQSSALRGQNT